MTTLRELIGIARELKGWTLRDLEKASGVSNALISQIEHGKVRDPGFTTVVRLCDALGLSLDRAASAERTKLDVLRKHGVWKPEAKDAQPHVTRYSDSSLYDEKCIHCGATDARGDDRLAKPCPGSKDAQAVAKEEDK